MKRIVVLGSNFAGLTSALEIKHALHDDVEVTVLSKSNRFLFTPSLIWLPFGWRKPEDITFPVGPVLESHKVHFENLEATRVAPERNEVETPAGPRPYDYLVIATGARAHFDDIPGLGPDRNSHNITTLEHAQRAHAAWEAFVKDPGPAVIGATQGASCFGAAYEYLFNFAHAVRKQRLARKVQVTFVTAEPFCGHFGIGGLRGGQKMLELFLRMLKIKFVTNARIAEVRPDGVQLDGGPYLPSKFSMIIPPFRGADAISASDGLGDDKGFVPVDGTYQHERYSNIYATGAAVAVTAPWQTPVAVGVPKTGFPAETMAKIAAHNIAAEIQGKPKKERRSFAEIPAVCVMDAGNNGVMIFSDKMLPPRKHEVLIPGPQAHWAKLAFEKYFLWKMQHGYVGMP